MSELTATVVIATCAIGVLLIALLALTVTFRQALRDIARDRMRDAERRDAQLSAILDRFQAIKWEDLVALRVIESNEQEGGFFTPAEQAETKDTEEIRWGPQSRLQRKKEQDDEEAKLLAEDFPDDYPVRETTT